MLWLSAVVGVGMAETRATTISVSEIRAGMRGYGLTVFKGTEPERFDVEVIDVLKDFRPNQSLILIRTKHPILDHVNVVRGMSGSPIYLDNRLAGAYAWGWAFGMDPVAGVTPIANMEVEMRRRARPDSFPGSKPMAVLGAGKTAASASASNDLHAQWAGLRPWDGTSRRGAFDPLRDHLARVGDGNTPPPGMVRASTPVMVGGFTDSIAAALATKLEPLGLVALQGGGGAGDPNSGPKHYVNGGAIGVDLIRGDISMTGVGTVTLVDGDTVAAFGHPMLNAGEVGLPTSVARVLHFLANVNASFKIAESLRPLGTLVQDRSAAIVIDTKRVPGAVPVHIRLRGVDDAAKTDWRFNVASHRMMTPMLVVSGIANAVSSVASDNDELLFEATSTVDMAGIGKVTLKDQGFAQAGLLDSSGLGRLRAFELMEAAYGNPFERSRVLSVDVDVNVKFVRDVIDIVDAAVPSEEVDPGSDVRVQVTLKQYGKAEEMRVITVHIPEDAAGAQLELRLEPGDKVPLPARVPGSLRDMVENVKNELPATALVTSVKVPSQGLRFRGQVVENLPGSALAALQPQNDTRRGVTFTTYDRNVLPLGSVVQGSAVLKLKVREEARGR